MFSERLKNAVAGEALKLFLKDLQSMGNIAGWRVQQAKGAMQLYTSHFHGRKAAGTPDQEIKATSVPFNHNLVLPSI